MKIAMGNDHTAIELKNIIKEFVESKGYEVIDLGTNSTESCDYPVYGEKVGRAVASGEADLGIAICGTGVGISLAANKVKGAYAALISDVYSAERARKSNNANVACFGAFTLGEKLMAKLVEIFLTSEFEEGCPSQPKVDRICMFEQKG